MVAKRRKIWGNTPRFKEHRPSNKGDTNRYQELSDLDDDISVEDDVVTERQTKVPPIIVDSCHMFADIIGLLGQDSKYKRMSIGTKVMPNTLDEYAEVIKTLKSKDIKFFTHPIKDNKKFKLMLFGLPQIDVKIILDEFKCTYNIEPESIKEVKTSRSSQNDALYMIEFSRNQISKKEITKIRYFSGIVVRWRNPRRVAQGPTQCSKCAMYGHGASNCFRKITCLGCGGAHDFTSCQMNKTSSEGPVIYKCFNCIENNFKNVNHRADDAKCPSRHEYMEIRQRVTNKQKVTRKPRHEETDSYIWDGDFRPPSRNDDMPGTSTEQRLPPLNRKNVSSRNFELPSFSKATKTNNKVPYATTARMAQSNENDDNDLSNEKLLEIFFNAIDALEKCKTKFDKMRVLGMMLKHVI